LNTLLSQLAVTTSFHLHTRSFFHNCRRAAFHSFFRL
jgi:hypothetical protein